MLTILTILLNKIPATLGSTTNDSFCLGEIDRIDRL